MIIELCEQLSDEWFTLKTGIPSASSFDKIFTTKCVKSAQADSYLNTLVAEYLTGERSSIKQTDWMTRGIEMEAEACSAYEFITGNQVDHVGLIFKDEARLVSCSPDGLPEGRKGLEIKCPAPGTHVGYLRDDKLPTTYFQQIHGSMWLTGLSEWDFMSYCPGLPPFIITVKRDPEIITAIDSVMDQFLADMVRCRQDLMEMAA